jgi:hypothetical protein
LKQNNSGDQKPLKKTGRYRKALRVGKKYNLWKMITQKEFLEIAKNHLKVRSDGSTYIDDPALAKQYEEYLQKNAPKQTTKNGDTTPNNTTVVNFTLERTITFTGATGANKGGDDAAWTPLPEASMKISLQTTGYVNVNFPYSLAYGLGPSEMSLDVRILVDGVPYVTIPGTTPGGGTYTFAAITEQGISAGNHTIDVEVRSRLLGGPPVTVYLGGVSGDVWGPESIGSSTTITATLISSSNPNASCSGGSNEPCSGNGQCGPNTLLCGCPGIGCPPPPDEPSCSTNVTPCETNTQCGDCEPNTQCEDCEPNTQCEDCEPNAMCLDCLPNYLCNCDPNPCGEGGGGGIIDSGCRCELD